MKKSRLLRPLIIVICLGLAAVTLLAQGTKSADPDSMAIEKKYQEGNYKEAYEGFRKLALDASADEHRVGKYLNLGIASLQALGRTDEIDEFREGVIKIHSRNWRLLQSAAESYLTADHSGFIVAGKFYRGPHRGGGKVVHSFERDRYERCN